MAAPKILAKTVLSLLAVGTVLVVVAAAPGLLMLAGGEEATASVEES